MAEFLFEIGLEEIPARMIAGAQAELSRRIVALLERERLSAPDVPIRGFSTPRRLAVWVGEVIERQQDLSEDLLGPSAKIAYKDGAPTPAAFAFAKKAGVPVEALRTVSTPKGEYLQATAVKPGRSAAEVLAAELPKELAALYWAKTMYWRAGRPERFVRPVRWLLALLGTAVVPIEFAGFTAAHLTYGHRVLRGNEPVEIHASADYEERLRSTFVLADVELRRHTIRKALDRVCRTLPNTRWREDHALVDKLTYLTEWPSVIAGSFDPELLALPEEVLVTVMRDHQSYLAVEDIQGKLAPHFLTVLNTQADAAGEVTIRHGNERVLRARFNDARFFWEFDQRIPLIDRVPLLEKVTFQKDLGSYAAKSERMREIARKLADGAQKAELFLDVNALLDAVALAKTDLTTELVKEFTELQGIVGGLYARAQDLAEATALAIQDQYKPESMEDTVPRTSEGAILALADKIDTISGMFSLGLEPTGSKDPFALRRAANGIVKILAESKPIVQLTLAEIVAVADTSDAVKHKLHAFFAERLEFYLREARGQSYDVVKAVLSAEANDVRDAVLRAEAVTAMRGSDDFEAVSTAFKRMSNILAQATEKGIVAASSIDATLLTDPSEESLLESSVELAARVDALRKERNYIAALEAIATLRPAVDAFFDAVMVMAPDQAIRANRLALLTKVLADFSGIADFAQTVTTAQL